MSDNKGEKGNLLDDLTAFLLGETDTLSGSTSSQPKVGVKTVVKNSADEANSTFISGKEKKKEKLIIPIEEWPAIMTKAEEVSYREYKKQQFPELYDIKNLENDKASEVPFLALTKPARIFAALLETSIKEHREIKKKKILH